MKKKLLIIIAVIVAAAALMLVVMVSSSLTFSRGRCLKANNGSTLVVLGNAPIVMSNGTSRDIFDDIETGDEILILHDGVNDSYPGQTGVYMCVRLGRGSIDDIPQETKDGLRQLGWIY